MDQEAEAAEARLPLQPGDEIVRKHDSLERRSEHEFARVQDERSLIVDLDELRQVLLRFPDIDVGVPRVVEDAEEPIDADVDARRLEQRIVVGVDEDPTLVQQSRDRPVGEDHGRDSTVRGGTVPERGLSQ